MLQASELTNDQFAPTQHFSSRSPSEILEPQDVILLCHTADPAAAAAVPGAVLSVSAGHRQPSVGPAAAATAAVATAADAAAAAAVSVH